MMTIEGLIEPADGVIDWDGTLIVNHSLLRLVQLGLGYNRERKLQFYRDSAHYLISELISLVKEYDLTNIIAKMLGVLRGLPYGEALDTLLNEVQLNDLTRVNERLGTGDKRLVILSKNDRGLISDLLGSSRIPEELEDRYRIRITGIIGNELERDDGVFTGRVNLPVLNKMQYLTPYHDKPFFGDWIDQLRCKSHCGGFVRV